MGPALVAPTLPALEPVPAPPLHRARRLSFTALSLFERCSYRYYAERVAGMRERDASRGVPGLDGLGATELGSAVHALLEALDLGDPRIPDDLEEQVRADWPAATDDNVERIREHVAAYCDSELAARVALLQGAAPERHFTFLHDGVLLHGFLDVFHSDGTRALVVDYKTNALDELEPAAVIDSDYRLQRLVYALACLRTGRPGGRGRVPVPGAARRARLARVLAGGDPGARSGALRGDRANPGRRLPAHARASTSVPGVLPSISSARDRASQARRGRPQPLR